ncbi:MAG: DUF2490 domain-containing protein [Saprospiraceae bacterium]|nr:DUF2490 domain-containing protein [Saprospiraceae bacterium]
MFAVLLAIGANAQNTRINDDNQVGWWAFFSTLKLNDRWGIHAEYQWRRENFVADWQQSLLRVGLNYQASKCLQLRLGYAWIETFPYGDIPINALGRDFTEHRAFQMATLTDKLGRLDLSHRFMLEQRWIGRYTNPEKEREDDYFFVNRLRYMLRLQCPLQGPALEDKEFYAAAYNEVFVGFGKNVNENVFDQNRIGLLVGYRLNKEAQNEEEAQAYLKNLRITLDFVIEEIILHHNFEKEVQLFQLLRLVSPETNAIHPNRYRQTLVQIGAYICPEPASVPQLVSELFFRMQSIPNPIIRAIYFHHEIIRIHPFVDGNGRVARIAKNWMLMYDLYPPIFINDAPQKKNILLRLETVLGNLQKNLLYGIITRNSFLNKNLTGY